MSKHNRSIPQWLVSTTIGGFFLCLSASSGAITDLGTVTITGHYSDSFALFSQSTFNPSMAFSPYRKSYSPDGWEYQQNQYEIALASPLSSNDLRCNIVVTQATKSTLSTSSATDRYLAAQNLLSVLSAQNGGRGAKAAISGSTYAYYMTGIRPTFMVVYADGGSEKWIMASLVPMALVVDGNLPGSLQPGSGQAEPCSPV